MRASLPRPPPRLLAERRVAARATAGVANDAERAALAAFAGDAAVARETLATAARDRVRGGVVGGRRRSGGGD